LGFHTVSSDSSARSAVVKTAVRAAVEGAVIAGAGAILASWLWPSLRSAVVVGVATAWAATSASLAWLFWARGRDMKTFWWAFGGGMAIRAGALGLLAVAGYRREGFSLEGLLLSYVFAVLVLLLTLELRHLRIR
jgi:hypothetical protein